MLNWEKIYELNGNNNKKAGTAFEKLVLCYLSSVYRKYSWKNTQSSWDNNRDFVSLILDNIWGEAKYKKDSSSLGKKDVDPTLVSGFLDGKIELVFIITNGQIPHTINMRINKTGKKCGFTVVCITQTQLEYWLFAHPEQYRAFFGENLPNVCQVAAVSIENINVENQIDANFESSYIQPEFVVDSICNLCVTFSCNADLKCVIVEKEEYPFQFIDHPHISLSPGVQQKYFLIKLIKANNDPIVLEFKTADNTVLSYVLDIRIVINYNPRIIYSHQEAIKIRIYNTVKALPSTNDNQIFAIQGIAGCGKTFLMKELAKDLSCYYVVSVLQCESEDFSYLNSMKLCQIIMYFNFGDIYQNAEDNNDDFKEYYKYLLLEKNYGGIIENDLLEDIFDGCFDRIIAKSVIERLSMEKPTIIKQSHFARKHILFVDDVNFFSKKELSVFKIIFRQLKRSHNNSILIFSGNTNLFEQFEIVPDKLEGLSLDDIRECLKANLDMWQYDAFSSKVINMPRYPKMLSELIQYIKSILGTNLSFDKINLYITNLYNGRLYNSQFDFTDEERTVLTLISNFSKGISEKLVQIIRIDEKILTSLQNKGCILCFKQRYMPCIDYFQYMYKDYLRSTSSNDQLAKYLCVLLDNSHIDLLFDVFQAQYLLIQCDHEIYLRIKENYKAKMVAYIKEGNYKAAMLYGEIFCFDMLDKESYCQEVDLEALFYYGIALIHSDSQRRAIDVFTYIKNHSEQNSLSYFRASAELLNNRYSRFQIDGVLPEAIVLKRDIQIALRSSQGENILETHQLRIAYSTCMNRMMMICFLKDNIEKAIEIYSEYQQYHLALPLCIYSDKYDTMFLEWKMDYARGLAIYNIQNSICMEKECYDCFSESIDLRRKILCKIDVLFYRAILYSSYDDAINELISCKQHLAVRGFVSEDMKASIRITYCRLMKYACIPEFDDITFLVPFVDEIYAEVYSTQLELHIIAQGRTAYLLNNLLAILHIIKKDIDAATEMLQYGMKLVRNCGETYRKIISHNCKNLSTIRKIKWYFHDDIMNNDTYYLDLRVW